MGGIRVEKEEKRTEKEEKPVEKGERLVEKEERVVEIKEKRRFLGIKNKCNTQYHILTCRILSVT